jgi:hypothetical protein
MLHERREGSEPFSNLFPDTLICATNSTLYLPVNVWYNGAESIGKHTKNQRFFLHPSSAGDRQVATPDKSVSSMAG